MSSDLLKNRNSPYDVYYDTKEDKIMDIIQKESFSTLRNRKQFDAYVLKGWNYDSANASTVEESGRYLAIYLRPIELTGFLIPPPCPNSPAKAGLITTLHPLAVSESPLVSSEMTFNVGDIVSCYFDHRAPAFNGQMRGLRFKLGKVEHATGNYEFDCLKAKAPLGFNQVGNPLGQNDSYQQQNVGKCRKGVSPGWYINDTAAQQQIKKELIAAYPVISPIVDDFVAFSAEIGLADPSWLANLINMESSWKTTAMNKSTHASGLIQWLAEYCPDLLSEEWNKKNPRSNFSSDKEWHRAAATRVRKEDLKWQWGKVKRRYRKYKGRLKYSADVYTAVFYPWAVGKPLNTDVAAHWKSQKKGRKIATFMKQNGGIRYKGDYARLASGKAKMPTYFC